MKPARIFVLFSYGLFTIAAQSLLFREFITTFEGNDIAIGIFFGSWFVWIGAAATLVRKWRFLADRLLGNIEILLLCYLPAFVLQFALIVQARELAGLESYALWSFRDILLTSFLVNAPVSIITGLYFPTACRWVEGEGAVSRVYIVEAAGSFVGGIAVTLLFWRGIDAAGVFFILGAVLSGSVFGVRLASLVVRRSPDREPAPEGGGGLLPRRPSGAGLRFGLVNRAGRLVVCGLSLLLPVFFLVLLAANVNNTVSEYLQAVKWKKLLSEEMPAGSFRTAQAEYIYGGYRGQWVVLREGSACEAIPDEATPGRIAAVALCQNPQAESVLVVGSGLGLCSRLLELPQIRKVTWAHTDPEYARKIDAFIPDELRITDSRFERLDGDLRRSLAENRQSYDIVVVDLPDATNSVLNRYYTVEFYELIQESLNSGGILAVRVSAGENIMGAELTNLGASIRLTLEHVFKHFVLTPGEESWFIASDSEDLTSDPAALRDRFGSIAGAERVFPSEALLSVYLPDRAEAAVERYSRADLPKHLLINRDSRPLTHLYSLLLTAKRSGAPFTRLAKLLTVAGPLVFLVGVIVFVVLRLLYIFGGESGEGRSGFDSTVLVFSAGTVGIGTVIVLMYLYQTYFGSLFLHIGIVSSLFMVGLTIAAVVTRGLLNSVSLSRRIQYDISTFLPICVVAIHSLVLAGIFFVPITIWESGHLLFAAAFLVCGLCGGCYFPIASRRLTDSGFETAQVGGRLETADHLGAAAGGVATSLVLVPVLGAGFVLVVFIAVMLANVPAAFVTLLRPHRLHFGETSGLIFRKVGFVLFGVAAAVIISSNMLVLASGRLMPSLPRQTAQAMVGELALKQISTALEETQRQADYFEVLRTEPNATQSSGYVFSSHDFAPEIKGFGGRINLAIYVDGDFKILDFQVVRSNETPSYLKLLDDWRESLKGRRLLGPEPFGDIDAVSGATVTSEAVLSALSNSANTFAREIIGVSAEDGVAKGRPVARYVPDARAAYLIAATAQALIVIYVGGFWSRVLVLAASCVVGGLLLNAQYSMEQAVTILSMQAPIAALSGAFMLAAGVPILVAVFGNVYCGYICPFGAAQELLGYVIPRRFKRPLSVEAMRKARFLKYAILFVLIAAFFISRNRTTLSGDPLISVFGMRLSIGDIRWPTLDWRAAWPWILAAALVGSIFYTRFWCRYLCPAGAFLSLLNKVRLLRRLAPAKKYGRCEFGLTAKDRLDCIYCDRCRYETAPSEGPVRLMQKDEAMTGLLSRSLAVVVLTVAALISAVSIDRLITVLPSYEDYTAYSIASGGQPRDVDLQRVEDLIRQKKLSDKEAEFYKRVE